MRNARLNVIFAAAASGAWKASTQTDPYNPMPSPQAFTASALPSHTLTADLSVGQELRILLDADMTIATPSVAPAKGAIVSIGFVQDGTGWRSVAWPVAFSGTARFRPRQGPNQASCAYFEHDGSNAYRLVGFDGIDIEEPLDVRDFGAQDPNLEDNSTDLSVLVPQVVAFGVSVKPSGSTVFIPDGNWKTTKPIVLSTHYGSFGVKGQSKWNTSVQGYHLGPNFLIAPQWTKPTVGAGPFANTGAWPLSGGHEYYINLSETYLLRLDGLGQNCIQLWVKLTSTTLGFIYQSNGGFKSGSDIFSNGRAFDIYCNGDDGSGKAKIVAHLNVAGSQKTLDPAAGIALNAWHHIAMDYDGSTVRLFIDGVSVKTQAATGNIAQTPLERILVGPDMDLNDGARNNMASGWVGPIKMDRVSQHTSSFTPPSAAFAVGADTQLIHNFDDEASNYFSHCKVQLFGQGGAGEKHALDFYPSFVRTDISNGLGNVELSNLTSSGNGIKVWATAHAEVHDLYVFGEFGIMLDQNSFISQVYNCFCNSSNGPTGTQTNCWRPRWGIHTGNASGGSLVSNCTVTGYMFALVQYAGGTTFRDIFLNPQADTRCPVIGVSYSGVAFGNSTFDLDNINFDSENSAPDWLCGAFFHNCQGINVHGGQWDMTGPGGGLHPFWVNACGNLNLYGVMAGGSVDAVNSLDSTTKVNPFGVSLVKGMTTLSTDMTNVSPYGTWNVFS